jgi:hypothetical protein
MRKIEAYLSVGLVGCKRNEIFEVEDDATDEEIEEIIKEWVYELVEWGWQTVEAKPAKEKKRAR